MATGDRRKRASDAWPIVNRLAQINVAIALAIAGMIRLSMSFSDTQSDRPDPLTVLGFFAAMAVALVFVYHARKAIHLFRRQWQRVTAALVTFGIQLAVLEILIFFVAE
ncbi:MAG: hypothetical protein WKF81_08585 [Thermomicrobiales bacterium]